ncbi:PadR family transcriptional regulator [Actinomadura roseirufa]|uniref:PadR family transcriptional regulator n=1 Tax=Actinomadura roseirufa TaxID=2094049 RepID=UPI001F5EF167|nr:helix-turn-helix transcriptional regulator [Actinomadura roseirufa]
MGRREREASGPRMTLPTQLVLRALLTEPAHEFYGLQIGQAAGLPSGTVHPILARLEALDWLESRWEDIDPAREGRPRRRYYRLTTDGAERARIALAEARTQVTDLPVLRPRPTGGTA